MNNSYMAPKLCERYCRRWDESCLQGRCGSDERGSGVNIGDCGNIIYVNPEMSISVGITGKFKPRLFDRMDFIEKNVIPIVERLRPPKTWLIFDLSALSQSVYKRFEWVRFLTVSFTLLKVRRCSEVSPFRWRVLSSWGLLGVALNVSFIPVIVPHRHC